MKNKYVRVVNGRVAEVFINTTNLTIGELFHADLAKSFELCDIESVEVYWVKHADGAFIAPVPKEPPEVAAAP